MMISDAGRLDFDVAEFEARHGRVRSAMLRARHDLLLLLHPVSIHWLVGCRSKSYEAFQCLFFPADAGPLVMLVRRDDVPEVVDSTIADEVHGWGEGSTTDPTAAVETILHDKGWWGRRTAIETPRFHITTDEHAQLESLLGPSLAGDASLLVEEQKFVKSPAELAYIRNAAAIADSAMETLTATARPGMTELEVAGEMHRTMMQLGSDTAGSLMNLGSGERSGYCLALPSERRLRPGDLTVVEFGAAYRRYTATIGRQLCLGRATQRMREIYALVREALEAALAEIRAGVPCTVPHHAAKQVIVAAGMEAYRPHSTGYGVAPGFPPEWREAVQMDDHSDYVLEAGMVLCVEPPVFLPEEGIGMRIIENVLVTENGCEVLSRFTRDLVEL